MKCWGCANQSPGWEIPKSDQDDAQWLVKYVADGKRYEIHLCAFHVSVVPRIQGIKNVQIEPLK